MESREVIIEWLKKMLDKGIMVYGPAAGLTRNRILRGITDSEFFATEFGGLVCRTEEVRDKFEGYVKDQRLLTERQLLAREGYRSAYDVRCALLEGKLARIKFAKNGLILYIR